MARGTGDEMGVPAPRAAQPARAAHLPVPVDVRAGRDVGLGAGRHHRPLAAGLLGADRAPARRGGALSGARMSRRLGLGALVAAALVSGCGNQGITRGGRVLSNTLTVYSLLPAPSSGAAADAVDGEKLALAQAGGRAGRFTINYASLDEGATGQRAQVADAARTVIGDQQAIAVIGGLDTTGTRTSAPLFNEAGF